MAVLVKEKALEKNVSPFLTKAEPRPKRGSKLPLFDRLIDTSLETKNEHPKKIILNRAQAIDSIITEIDRLLNTRLSATAKIYSRYRDQDYGLGLPWMYGIPDFTSIDPADKTQWWRTANLFENAITYFEPRIKNVKVAIDHFDGKNQRLYVSIRGQIAMKEFQQPVAFGVEVREL